MKVVRLSSAQPYALAVACALAVQLRCGAGNPCGCLNTSIDTGLLRRRQTTNQHTTPPSSAVSLLTVSGITA